MNAGWHRAVVGLGLVLAGVLLSGCHARGTFDVLSEERVAVDLIVTGADVNCPHGADALKLTVTTTIDQYGDQVCHVTGETQATYFSPFGITISPAAEYLVLQANLSGGIDSWPAADIDVRFPGKVMDASLGSVSDNVVRITDLGELTQGSGLHAVGLASPGPPQWMTAALAGAGGGIAVTLIAVLIVVMVRRRHSRAPALDPGFPDTVPGAASGGASGAASVVPEPAMTVAPVERVPATSAGPPAPRVEDTSWFARPPSSSAPNGKAVNGAGSRHAGSLRRVADGAFTDGPVATGAISTGTVTDGAMPIGTVSNTADGADGHARRPTPELPHTAWARPPETSGDQKAG